MMTRLILTICLMIGLMMPSAWAGEKDASASPLSQVTIEAEDWIEGDTYYIRYTFTNPTNEMIDEEVDFTTVGYHYYNYDYKDNGSSTVQCDETLSHLTIAPHSSYTATVSLKQPAPSIFNQLVTSTFYFKDSSYLNYCIASEAPKSHFSLSPSVSPAGDIFLTIQNNSPTETITELRNILIAAELQGKRLHLLRAEPYLLNVMPHEAVKLPVYSLDSTSDKKSPYSSYYISMAINSIPHRYNVFKKDSRIIMGSNDTFEVRYDSHYAHSIRPQASEDSSYYLDGTALYVYLQINSRDKKEMISAPNAAYVLSLPYFDKNAHSQSRNVSV